MSNSASTASQRITIGLSDLDREGHRVEQLRKLMQNTAGILRHYLNTDTEVVYVIFRPSQLNLNGLLELVSGTGLKVDFTQP